MKKVILVLFLIVILVISLRLKKCDSKNYDFRNNYYHISEICNQKIKLEYVIYLEENDKLIGLSRQEIIKAIGEPSRKRDDIIVYYLIKYKEFNELYMEVKFNEENIVIEALIHQP